MNEDGRRRVVIENVSPQVDDGRFAIKRVAGEKVRVEVDIFADGHDQVAAVLRYRKDSEVEWSEVPLRHMVNDRWRAEFLVLEIGCYWYTVQGWVDHFLSWRRDLVKKAEAGQDVRIDLQAGAMLVEEASARARSADANRLKQWARALRDSTDPAERIKSATDDELDSLMRAYPDRRYATAFDRNYPVMAERERARFSSWYEMFPRSTSKEPGRHGTLRDCADRLSYVAQMGFDVLYLPPIHPIGKAYRKGPNNTVNAAPGDPGSPWGIGGAEGGHKAIHPELGSMEDFQYLLSKAAEYGIELALDVAFQCSPDHPWVKDHPEWFKKRPDGTIQYAENPPKKYQDIYPIDFESSEWKALWKELKSVFEFWISKGVKIFRVDNPHTKAFPFWEWCIGELKKEHPETIYLSEAFTRPKVMHRLAKLGYTQSYTYFTWRNTKWELTEYFTELTQTPVREFFRPNVWPNTPDILHAFLQTGGRPAFLTRLVLAATLGANYGIYGPAYELMEHKPREAGSEEYLNSEKYQVRHWDLARPDSLKDVIARVNRIRKENPALQSDWSLEFHPADNEEIICYSKATKDFSNIILCVVNLDNRWKHSCWIDLDLEKLGIDPDHPFQVHDLLTDSRYMWHGRRNYVELDPHRMPAHILRLRRKLRTERDFDYYS